MLTLLLTLILELALEQKKLQDEINNSKLTDAPSSSSILLKSDKAKEIGIY